MVVAVLVVPPEGDPHSLLSAGLCGAQPPRVWFDSRAGEWAKYPWRDGELMALPLVWDQQLIESGWDPLCRLLIRGFAPLPGDLARIANVRWPNLLEVEALAQFYAQHADGARLVRLVRRGDRLVVAALGGA